MTLGIKRVKVLPDNPNGEAPLRRKKVLIIDDQVACQRFWRLALAREKIELLSATTHAEGFSLFRTHREEIGIIVFDGRLEPFMNEEQAQDDLQRTLDLIRRIKIMFSGHMVAAASRESDRALMMEAGCNREFDGGETKIELVQYIIQLLKKKFSGR